VFNQGREDLKKLCMMGKLAEVTLCMILGTVRKHKIVMIL